MAERLRVLGGRLTVRSSLYVGTVAGLAAVGFGLRSPGPIVLAALLALPASLVAVPAYYLGYGLLALAPGANPSSASGSSTVAPDGSAVTTTAGDAVAWFTAATGALGVLALTAAALLDVVLLRRLAARRRGPVVTPREPGR